MTASYKIFFPGIIVTFSGIKTRKAPIVFAIYELTLIKG